MISFKEFKEKLKTDPTLSSELKENLKGKVTENLDLLIEASLTKTQTRLSGDEWNFSLSGTALSVGSCRVNTINLARIAYECLEQYKDKNKLKEKYIEILKDRVLLDCKALTCMRHIIQRNIEKGLLPNYQEGALELDKQYCTIGIIGMYEVMDLYGLINTDELGYKSYSDEALEFSSLIMDTINEVKDSFECDFSFNVENIPAENAAGVLATADNLLYETNKYYILSNQWIPLYEKCSIQEKCKLGSLLDKKCGGGQISHINIEGRFPNTDVAWDMLNYIAEQGVIYSAFNPKIGTCKHEHASIGCKECPECGELITETWSRVVGFFRPTSSFQNIRKKEFDQRKWYDHLIRPEIM